VSDEALQAIRKRIESMKKEILRSQETGRFLSAARSSGFENVVAKFQNEYYTMLS